MGCALKSELVFHGRFSYLSNANVRENSVVKLWSSLWQVFLLKAQGVWEKFAHRSMVFAQQRCIALSKAEMDTTDRVLEEFIH